MADTGALSDALTTWVAQVYPATSSLHGLHKDGIYA